MEIIESNQFSLEEHKRSIRLMLFYFTWWTYAICWFSSDKSKYPNACGAANGAIIMFTTFIIAIFSLFLLIEIINCKKDNRLYYLMLFGIVWLPPFSILLYKYFL